MIKLIYLKLNCGSGSGGGGGGGGGGGVVVDVKLWMFIGGGDSKIGKVQTRGRGSPNFGQQILVRT